MNKNVNLQIIITYRLTELDHSSASNHVYDDNSILFVENKYAGIEIK